ncbi:DUF4118 domain-containing protein [Rhodococcus sp. IEGM 1379]|uniref:sensor histidine kinase n=1 Tax=Rhodococcus sp. IEGM 1379 TaxID=3047086 RepID=UPI0024B671D9|nr:DUF4118 domain-containing protein [Rhodococcus sp. IEGM 1379]MDI9914459.1 DUF4118 domain-containing protein [Rhodococcus sp. IEGM 1379]
MRGTLRIYFGAAPGVGKTYAMLCEGQRRRDRGTDVVVGYVDCHQRPRTIDMLDDLEVIPSKTMKYRDATFTEMDTDAILEREPRVAIVDELAHTNVPGSRHEKRWQDLEELLDAGIDVITTVNIQHLESLNDVVAEITRVPQRETVPDEVVRRAEQVELVDMAPEALRRRMADGNIYPPEKIVAALGNYFRVGNLTALRELAVLWLADKVDDQLDRYRAEHHITGPWEARERVVVGLTGGPEGETLIRRAARIVDRSQGADLFAVHITRDDGLTAASPAHLLQQRTLVENLGGTFHQVVGDDVPSALLAFTGGVNATQLVLGASSRGRIGRAALGSVGMKVVARSGGIDVHIVTHEATKQDHYSRLPTLAGYRQMIGFAVALVGTPLLSIALANTRRQLTLPSEILIFLIGVVGVALVGGLWPALVAAVLGSALLNYYFTPPLHRFTIAEPQNILALFVFIVIAIAVSAVVDLAARRTREAALAAAQATILSNLSGSVLRGDQSPGAILERLRETYGLDTVTLLERPPGIPLAPGRQQDPQRWRVAANVGGQPCDSPDDGDMAVAVNEDLSLALRGRTLAAADQQVLEAFAAQSAMALRQIQLEEEAEQGRTLAEADQVRSAILRAVGRDLRIRLAALEEAITQVQGTTRGHSGVAAENSFPNSVSLSLQRLDQLAETLLEISRPHAGWILSTTVQPVELDDVVPRAFDAIGTGADGVRVDLPDDLPAVLADSRLLERVLVDLLTHALRRSPPDQDVRVTARRSSGDAVELLVTDRGPSTPRDYQKDLGISLSESIAEAMGGVLTSEHTADGLTMILALPAAGQ